MCSGPWALTVLPGHTASASLSALEMKILSLQSKMGWGVDVPGVRKRVPTVKAV